MNEFEDRISNQSYKMWLKAGLCLGFLKDGLCPFVVNETIHQHRNKILQSAKMELSDVELRMFANDMITFLKSIVDYKNNPAAQTAVQYIIQARDTDIEITVSDEICVLKETEKGIQDTIKKQLNDINQLQKTFQELETNTDEIKDTNKKRQKKTDDQIEELRQLEEKVQDLEMQTGEMKKSEQREEMKLPKEKEKEKAVEISEGEMSVLAKGQGKEIKELRQDPTEMMDKQDEEVGGWRKTVEAAGQEVKRTAKMEHLMHLLEEMKMDLEEKLIYIKTISGRLQELMSPEKQHKRKVRELKQRLIELYQRNCMDIPVSPLHTKQKTFPIQQMYTDLVLVEKTYNKDRTNMPVMSYKQIFYKGSKRRKNIFVLGDAGTGKSTFAKKMAADWVRAHTEDGEGKTANIKMMEHFDFLFYVPLCSISNCVSVFDAVCQNLAKFSGFQATIKRLFETQSEGILVVCDGLDEIKEVLDERCLHDCTTVTTTRPWKFNVVDQTLYPVDITLELQGLTREGIADLVGKVLEVVFENTMVETRLSLLQAFGASKELKSFAKIPLLLVYLIHIWFEGGRALPTSLTSLLTQVLVLTLRCGESRLYCMENIQSLQILWKSSGWSKDLFGRNKYLTPYMGLLESLSNFALEALTCPDDEQSDDDIEKYFDLKSDGAKPVDASVHVDACVRLGLLTKTEFPSFLGDMYTFSFPHKVLRDFFSALVIAQSLENGKSKFLMYCTSVHVLLEMSSVFRFACGLRPDTGTALSEELVKMYNTDLDVMRWRHNTQDRNSFEGDICRRLTLLYCDCIAECSRKCDSAVLHLTDCVMEKYTEYRGEQMIRMVSSNRTDLVSLDLAFDNLQLLHAQDSRVLSDMKNLVKLCVYHATDTEAINVVLETAGKLQSLLVEAPVGRHLTGLRLPVCQHLRHLRLERVSTKEDLLQQLQALFSLGHLKSLRLYNMSVDLPLDISPLTLLLQLRLMIVVMTSSVWHELLSSLGSCHSLMEVYIREVWVQDTENACTLGTTVDLKGCTQLQDVHITHSYNCTITDTGITCRNVSSSTQYLSPLVSSLPQATHLTRLRLSYLDRDCRNILLTVLPRLCNLTQLELMHIDFGGHPLSLCHNAQLQILRLQCVLFTSGVLDLTHNTHLKYLVLNKIRFVNEISGSYMSPVKKSRHDEGSGSMRQLVLASDMEVQELKLQHLFLSEDTWHHVFSCVKDMQHLQQLELFEVNATVDRVRLPIYMQLTDKAVNRDSTIFKWYCNSGV